MPKTLNYFVEELAASKRKIAALEAQLAALQWTLIDAEHLPTEEDMLLDCNGNIERVDNYSHWGGYDAESWAKRGHTHFRPINAPEPSGVQGKENAS